jgi:branched-chain amino acid transport system permease protein
VHDAPGALEQEFTPDIEMPHARSPEPAADVRLGGWTREGIIWAIVGLVFLAWAIWAFIDEPVHFVSLLGAGLAQGAVVSLAALGFILIMKATGIANFAQGDLITVGAFLGVWATSKTFPAADGLGLSLGLGFALTLVIMFFLGILIELVAYRPLSKRSHDVHVVVIATLGVAIIIRTVMSLWQGGQDRSLRSWFNPGEKLQNFGIFDDGVFRIHIDLFGETGDAVISAQRVVIMIVTAIVVVAIMLLFSRTSFGRQVRAIAADRETARLYGVRANNLSMLAFGISSFLAGLAGLMIGSLNNFNLTLGFSYMLLGFAAAVLGGFGSLGGTVLGGILIGLTEQLFGGQMFPLLVDKLGMDPQSALRYASALPYVLMLVVIAVRPQGLFGRASKRL